MMHSLNIQVTNIGKVGEVTYIGKIVVVEIADDGPFDAIAWKKSLVEKCDQVGLRVTDIFHTSESYHCHKLTACNSGNPVLAKTILAHMEVAIKEQAK